MVYGRRKTGKSFYVEHFVKHDKYLFVYRDKSIKDIKALDNWSFDELKRYILENKDKTIVVDEFHRLDESFLDFLHSLRSNNLILITSSLHIAKKVLNKNSPILGLVYPIKFDILEPYEILPELFKNIKENYLEFALLLREPTLLELIDYKNPCFEDFLLKYYNFAKYWSRALFGEIFEDEDRTLTETYEGIIRSIALGKNYSNLISSYLFENRLISKDNPSMISPYLDVLYKLGIIDKIELYGKVRNVKYVLTSNAIDFYFYLNSKYGDNLGKHNILEAWKYKVSLYLEDFVSELLAKYYGLKKVKYSLPDNELDVCLLKFKKIDTIGSIKWTSLSKIDLSLVRKNLDVISKNKFLLVKDINIKTNPKEFFNIYEPKDLLTFCK